MAREALTDRPAPARARLVESLIRQWCRSRESAGQADPTPDAPLLLESLEAVELGASLQASLGIVVPVELLLDDVTLAELAQRIAEEVPQATDQGVTLAPIESAPEQRYEPFELTEIQQAYLLGRTSLFELGGVSTHVYFEWEADNLDLDRLGRALQRVIDRHEMLRAVVLPEGRQRILEHPGPHELRTDDVSSLPQELVSQRLEAVRDEMSHQVLPADRWPLFDVRAHTLPGGRTRVHVSLDLLIADGPSILILVRDWAAAYADPDAPMPSPEVSFRDYVLARSKLKGSDAYARSRRYWTDRLTTMPPAPDLPLARQPSHEPVRFVRREIRLDASAWSKLKRRARLCGVTSSAFLCTAYCEVIGAWSGHDRFTVNVTLADRLPIHPGVAEVVGDFTSSILLEVDSGGADAFDAKAQRLRKRLSRDLDHRLFPGVEVQRELAKSGHRAARMPVVFTSLLGTPAARSDGLVSDLETQVVYAISQTPQVYLDHQAIERAGEVQLIWDAAEELFPDGLLDAMLAAYRNLLVRLSEGAERVPRAALTPPAQLAQRTRVNATSEPIEAQLLHAAVGEQPARRRDQAAIIAPDRRLTYDELDRRVNQIARRLRELGARPNTLVAIVMEKGWQQPVAALAIVRSGAAYLPIDASLPARRIEHLLARGEVRLVLTQRAVAARVAWPAGIHPLLVDDDGAWLQADASPIADVAEPEDLAYVIFTSGSTGEPKGATIAHRAAANTVVDCVRRFQVTARDRLLGVSSLSFDLSVFDIFGALGAGATLVLPNPADVRDPGRLAACVREQHITIWNSVPALLEMLVEYAGGRRGALGDSLRLALLSGDWIPVDLPDRARRLFGDIEIIGMGGATEASIWSVLYPVGEVHPQWASIPYGKPMANQTLHVLDAHRAPRPVWVPGELYIGGRGVAAGYWREPRLTAERFVEAPGGLGRLYRTGDIGRYLPDGNIQFLGRQDDQVKIRGHRVEPGEVEVALLEHPHVRSAVVVAHGAGAEPKRLVAYVVPEDGDALDPDDCRAFLAGRLPEYMVPSNVVVLDELPLTANGKVDRNLLPLPAAPAAAPERSSDTDIEDTLTRIWSDVLGLPTVERERSFFELGGDSLLAMRVIAKAGAAGIRVDAEAFFERPTLAALVASAGTAPARRATQGLVTGDVRLTPSQRWFFGQGFADPHHWNGFWPLIGVPERLDPELLSAALRHVLLHHDGLRIGFQRGEAGWTGTIAGAEVASPAPLAVIDLSLIDRRQVRPTLERACAALQGGLDLSRPPLLKLTYFDLGPTHPGRLHLVAHWAVLDYYSSRVFFEDLRSAYLQLRSGDDPRLPPKTTPLGEYGRLLHERAQDPEIERELELWTAPERRLAARLPLDRAAGPNDQASTRQLLVVLDPALTAAVLRDVPREHGCTVAEMLLTSLGRAISRWTGHGSMLVELEAHGRRHLIDGVDLSRTVGRCSTLAPYHLEVSHRDDPRDALASVRAQLGRYPHHGTGFGLLAHLSDDPEIRRALASAPTAPINFNYWGQANEYLADAIWPFEESPGPLQSSRGARPRILDVFAVVVGERLGIAWLYSRNLHRRRTIRALGEDMAQQLSALAGARRRGAAARGFTVISLDQPRPVRTLQALGGELRRGATPKRLRPVRATKGEGP